MSKSKEEIMGAYHATMAGVTGALRSSGLEVSPLKALLDPSHPLATTSLALEARAAWADAADVWGNSVMAARIRSVEAMVAVLGGK